MIKNLKTIVYNFSKRIGDKVGIDLPYFVENGFWMTLNQSIVFLTSIATSVVFARLLSKEIFGQYQLVLSIISALALFSVPGLNTSINRAVSMGYDGDYKRAVFISFKFSFLGSIVLLLVAVYYFYISKNFVAISLIISSLFFPFLFSLNKWQALLKGKLMFESFVYRNIIQLIVRSGVLLAIVCLNSNSLISLIISYLIITSFFQIIWFKDSLRFMRNKLKKEDTFSYGYFITKMGILTTIVSQFDKILIGVFDIEMLAIYSVALAILSIITNFVKSISSITFPKFAKQNIKISIKHVLIIIGVGLAISIFLFVFSEQIITLLYTDKYIKAVDVFRILVFILPVIILNSILSKKAQARKQKRVIFILNFINPIITIIFSVTVFIFSKNIVYFIYSKYFISNILNLLTFVIPLKKIII